MPPERWRGRVRRIYRSIRHNASVSALVPLSEPAHASIYAPSTYASSFVSQERAKDDEALEELSGFIFLCNGRTKPECYKYRAFGLPAGRMEVVEKIKPGVKLFLFDFEVRSILSLFHPFTMPPSASVPMPPALPYTAMPQAVLEPGLSPATENQFQPQARLPPLADQYVPGIQLRHIPSVSEPQHALYNAGHPHYAYYRSSVNLINAHLSRSQDTWPAPRLIHLDEPFVRRVPGSHDPSMLETEDVAQTLLPLHYDSYEAMVNMVQSHPVVKAQMSLASTTSNISAEVQPAYLLGNTSVSLLDPPQRYMEAGELVPRGQHFGFGVEYHRLPSSQRHAEVVLRQENAVQTYVPSL